jgi:hypothetical protein
MKVAYIVTYPATVSFTIVAENEQDALIEAAGLAYNISGDDVTFRHGSAYISPETGATPTIDVDDQYVG